MAPAWRWTLYGPREDPAPAGHDPIRLPQFRSLDETELQRLDDDALIGYMRRARAAGHPSAGLALAILVYGHWANVERRVAMKVPREHVQDLTADIVLGAISSSFDGTSLAQFVAWRNTITQRAIADFYRRGHGANRPEASTLAGLAAPSEEGAVEVRDAIGHVMAALRPDHRRVIEIVVLEDGTAADAVRALPGLGMTEANVHQIVSRFRRALRGELGAGGDTGSG